MNSLKKYLVWFTLIAFSACDPTNTVRYYVENQTTENFDLIHYMSKKPEEKFEISENSKVKIFESLHRPLN